MYQEIAKHGQNLKRIFGIDGDPVEICKKLRRLEVKANRTACDYCNGAIDCEKWGDFSERTKGKVLDIIGHQFADAIFINGDPRGYTLKIDDEWLKTRGESGGIHRDWGGYGILAPDLSEEKAIETLTGKRSTY